MLASEKVSTNGNHHSLVDSKLTRLLPAAERTLRKLILWQGWNFPTSLILAVISDKECALREEEDLYITRVCCRCGANSD